jgi:hypothetical protein
MTSVSARVRMQSADPAQFYEARGVKISMLGAYNEVSFVLYCRQCINSLTSGNSPTSTHSHTPPC